MEFEDFIYECFRTIAPARHLSENWHIRAIAHYLQNIHKYKRLIINIPPRCMKSVCVSVAWPAWILGKNPTANIVVASYSQGLSVKHSLDTRCIMQSDWYKDMFPKTILSREQNTKHKFLTTQRGFRFATSVGGTLTGEGADVLIADDPITPLDVHNKKYRDRIVNWFEQVFVSRLNCLKTGVIVIVMHRLHQEDLVGYLLARQPSRWEHLSCPIVADFGHYVCFGAQLYRAQNNILDSSRFSMSDIGDIKETMGSYAFSAQYQQRPNAMSGKIIKKEYFKRYEKLPDGDSYTGQSWDTANVVTENSNYSVCITYKVISEIIYILDVTRGRFIYPELKAQVETLAEKWSVDEVLIEEKASGIQLIQDFKGQDLMRIIGVKPRLNKVGRLCLVLPMIESGKVALPYYASWLEGFEEEIFSFPNSVHDDQIDSLTQLLIRWKSKKKSANLTMRCI